MSKDNKLTISAASDVGLLRATNEDALVVGEWLGIGGAVSYAVEYAVEYDRPQRTLLAIADGLGGHRGGAVASQVVVRRLSELSNIFALSDSAEAIAAAQAIDEDLRLQASIDPSLNGMASTIAMAYVSANALSILNVGDSRIYFAEGADDLRQITVDDVPNINLAPNTAGSTARRRSHRITQALGGGSIRSSMLRPNTKTLIASPPWTLLLCSDGLSDYVDEEDLISCVRSPSCSANDLVDLALKGGGGDNVSVILARCSRSGGLP